MKIVISIPVHERKDVILDQIRNIQCYVNNPIIILHISHAFFENEKGSFEEIDGLKDVFINPKHYSVGWGNIAHVHISNFLYISSVIGDFDFFLIHASNDMYVKKGIEDYICKFEAGIQRRILRYRKTMWCPCECAWRDGILLEIMHKCNAEYPVGTQIEGCFFKKEVFEKIVSYIGKSEFWIGENYTREELYFSTITYSIVREEQLGYPTTFSEVHRYDRGLWIRARLLYSFSVLPFVRLVMTKQRYERIYKKMALNYKNKMSYAISKKDIDKIRSHKKSIFRNNIMKDYPGEYKLYDGNIFSVKRIPRDINHSLRKYLRRKSYEDNMSQGILETGEGKEYIRSHKKSV